MQGHLPGSAPQERVRDTFPQTTVGWPHLALALPAGLVAVGIKAFVDGTVARAAHGVPPPAFGAREVDPVGKQVEGCTLSSQSQRKPAGPGAGPSLPLEGPQFPLPASRPPIAPTS